MSEFRVEVVELGPIVKHPNADSLSITQVYGGYPVIIRTGEFAYGDRAVYISVDAVVPADDPRWSFLAGKHRIKAKRLRGIYSQGILTAADPVWSVGQDVRNELRITKYEPPEPLQMGGENEKDPGFIPHYTDIEGLRRWPDVLRESEEVVITEKLHGCNARYTWHQERLWVGSHHGIKREDPNNLWWKIAAQKNLADTLSSSPGIVWFGEVYGQVQDLKYGAGRNDLFLAMFDAFDISTGRYLDYDDFASRCAALGLNQVPRIYRGPWHSDQYSLAEGPSLLADHVREGFVIKPTTERFDERIGRVILKLIGEGYLLRKD